MKKSLSKAYDQKKTEDKIYGLWEKSGFFNPDKLPLRHKKPFVVIMPPPNANGALHIGHAVFVTLQDVMVRFWRMRGKKALWLPGADHAGIETEQVYKKKLEKEGRRWSEIPRQKLYNEIFKFTRANKAGMESQLRKLGASCDWSREKFTLDEDIVKEVQDTFVQMTKDDLIYRGLRIVNWSVKDQTALSDLEIEYREQKDPLYYIKYGPLDLATVRPETKFGDTALAVHPKDKRYKKYIGCEIEIETVLGPAKIKVIADKAVDPDFGTGVVKVTPAHDPADFEIGLRHNLEVRQVIDRYGKMNDKAGPYCGLKAQEARQKVVKDMEAKGLIVKVDEDYAHSVAYAKRSGSLIEPMVLPQWFVSMTKPGRRKKSLRDEAIDIVKDKKIKFVPQRFEKTFFQWMKNLRDWNISRQIIWGIRIPAWHCRAKEDLPKMGFAENVVPQVLKGKTKTYRLRDHGYKPGDVVALENSQTKTLFGHAVIKKVEEKRIKDIELPDPEHGGGYKTLKELLAAFRRHPSSESVILGETKAFIYSFQFIPFSKKNPSKGCSHIVIGKQLKKCPNCEGRNLKQDPDVLDTWFSSGQWPFLALGYPGHKDYKAFYPTDVMETGWDILFFWVARMIMLGTYRTSKPPFHTVYLHGLVRDKDRQKMSKSKGNVIDPLGVAEAYGTDAVRMALVVGNAPGRDIIISEEKIRGYRNFANKVWNIGRFILMNTSGVSIEKKPKLSEKDKKYLAGLEKMAAEVTKNLNDYKFYLAAEKLYGYIWHTFADKIIEDKKKNLDDSAKWLLLKIYITCLRLLHPFMPFVTEEIYTNLLPDWRGKKMLIVENWPKS